MSAKELPIQFFAPREGDRLKAKDSGNTKPLKGLLSEEDLRKRALKLINELEEFAGEVRRRQKKEFAVPFVFIAKLCAGATGEALRRDTVNLLQTGRQSKVIGRTYSDVLLVRMDTLEEMKTVTAKLKNYVQYRTAISCLACFAAYEPTTVMEEGPQNYKVKLFDFQDDTYNEAIRRRFEEVLKAKEIPFKKTYYTDSALIYTLENTDRAALHALSSEDVFAAVFSLEPMPKYKMNLNLFVGPHQQVPVGKPQENVNYVTVGILDSGIAATPHLSPWLEEQRWTVYPTAQINPAHGTFVAGIMNYGDACENQEWVGHKGVKLFDANIFPDTEIRSVYENELIENIKEVIGRKHRDVKIWNLSISIKRPADDSGFSDFALALDALQEKYDILLCKSAGNCNNFMTGKPQGRIYAGADSIRSLVVGSIAQEKNRCDLAEVDNPSPFTRIGPGPEYVVKPEIVHYGGNAGLDASGKLAVSGVRSFAQDGVPATTVGTSFSNARVTGLAAGVYQELLEEFDPLLLKSLIIHSAAYPENLKIPRAERLKQVGFGRPRTVREIVYNSPHEATLIFRDKLVQGECLSIRDFPLPACLLKDGFYTGQIVATLVQDPLLDPAQGAEYVQSNIELQFGSYDERNYYKDLFQLSLYSKRKMNANQDDFALRERLLMSYGDIYYPVKKYAVNLAELTEANRARYLSSDKRWFLSLQVLFRDSARRKAERNLTELTVEFCLVITMRDPLGKAPVYAEVTQKLDELIFPRRSIKLARDGCI